MTGAEIREKYSILNRKLYVALQTLERKDTIFEIRQKMKELQKECPHYDNELQLDFTERGECPYCGKKMNIS